MQSFEKYEHHGKVVSVRTDLKGRHREHCLCFRCEKLMPDGPENCQIAEATYQHCIAHNLVTPVWECPEFEPA